MRKTNAALAADYPSYAETLGDRIGTVLYGDEPMINYNKEYYDRMAILSEKDNTIANLLGIDQYVYKANGDFLVYRMLCGDIYTKPDGTILSASVVVKCRGKIYKVWLFRMYGDDRFSITYNSGGGVYQIWCGTEDKYYAPLTYKLMEYDTAMSVVSVKHDYGKVYQDVLDICKDKLLNDKNNYGNVIHI